MFEYLTHPAFANSFFLTLPGICFLSSSNFLLYLLYNPPLHLCLHLYNDDNRLFSGDPIKSLTRKKTAKSTARLPLILHLASFLGVMCICSQKWQQRRLHLHTMAHHWKKRPWSWLAQAPACLGPIKGQFQLVNLAVTQWNACLFPGADGSTFKEKAGIFRPKPYFLKF